MVERFAAACRSVADEIERGDLRPGRAQYFLRGAPCCAFGHVLDRVGAETCGEFMRDNPRINDACTIPGPDDIGLEFEIANANDTEDWGGVVDGLRTLASRLEGAR